MPAGTRFSYELLPALPPLAWLAHIRGSTVEVRCGTSVRCEESGFVEGSWLGEDRIDSLPQSTTVFGSGVVADGNGVVVVPPSHPLERIYLYPIAGGQLVSNSLVWLLEAGGVELDRDALYPPIFVAAAEGVQQTLIEIPTTGQPVTSVVNHNLRISPAGSLEVEERPHERPFTSFDDYRRRLAACLSSAAAKVPTYGMVVSISSGYDSTAVAAVAAQLGCRRAVTFTVGKPVPSGASPIDSGAANARRLGMVAQSFERLAYLERSDLPEAEFLATGMSGEDVVAVVMAEALAQSLVLTGGDAFRLKGNRYRPGLYRGDLSSCSLTEFRLRTDFVHVPLLFFGASEQPSLIKIMESAEMRPYVVPGKYDKPIQRRISEDAGIPRGSFATVKRRASATIHSEGLAAMAPASATAVLAFATAEGRSIASGGRRDGLRRRDRLILRVAKTMKMPHLASPLAQRRRALIHFDPEFGSLLFRWAVSVVRRRYVAELQESGVDASGEVAGSPVTLRP